MIPGVNLIEIVGMATILFFLGVYGFLTRRNMIAMLMALELMLNGAAINFIAFERYVHPGGMDGLFFTFFIIAVAAAEVALAIAIIINLYRKVRSVDVDEVNTLKE